MGGRLFIFRVREGNGGIGCVIIVVIAAGLAAITMFNLLAALFFTAIGVPLPGPAPYDTPTAIQTTRAQAGLEGNDEWLLLVSDERLLASDGSTASISPAAIAKPEADGGVEPGPGETALYVYQGGGAWNEDAADFVAPDPVTSSTEQEWNGEARAGILSALSSALSGSGWNVEDVRCVQSGGYRFTATYTATGPGGDEGSGRVLGVYLGPSETVTGDPIASGIMFSVPEGAELAYGGN